MHESPPSGWHGLFLAATSSLFFSVCSLIAKFLPRHHPLQLSCYGFVGILLIAGPVALTRDDSIFPEGCTGLLLLRSFCGTVFLTSSFYAVQVLPLGDASVLFYTAPVFTLILARWLLKEPCPKHCTIIVSTIAVGVLLVTQPPLLFSNEKEYHESESYWLGVSAAITASISEAVGNITLRKLKNLHFSVILTNYGISSLVQVYLGCWYFTAWSLPDDIQLSLILLLAFFTSVEQILMTLALSIEHAGPVALVQASDIIYGYIYQVTFFEETFNFWSAVGAVLVASVVIYLTNERRSRSRNSVG